MTSEEHRAINDCGESASASAANESSYTSSLHDTSSVEHVPLTVARAFMENGTRRIRVNVMLDPCSPGSYISERAAEELHLKGEIQNLTISGTAGLEVKADSRRVKFTVTSVFSSNVEANVLNDITGNIPTIQWNDLKHKWTHLQSIPFEGVAKRRQIDVGVITLYFIKRPEKCLERKAGIRPHG